ncbi:MAG TPA: hypothetical protein VLI69_01355 [Gammaproteobacteria bacterium]|nr:hypothetical protein [Gammaproteobacteria bacterium]
MSAVQPLCILMGVKPHKISKETYLCLEAELFAKICEALTEYFRNQQKEYFNVMKFTTRMENAMLEENFIRLIIDDVLLTKEYTAKGIAQYADTHEDVVCEVMLGINTNPSAKLLRRVIELHRTVRKELYQNIMKKIVLEYSNTL